MKKRPVITIDGPAGAGKSTISKELARKLSFIYLDTGALYRAVAYSLDKKRVSTGDENLASFLKDMKIELKEEAGQLHVYLDGEDVTKKIRTEVIGLLASKVSALPIVREALFSLQRECAAAGGVVAEGRDMGTVVFPDAEIKFFLDASVEERARRRYTELLERGDCPCLENIRNDIILRDDQDRGRSIAPLRAAATAIVIDSTDRTIPQVLDIMMGIINNAYSLENGGKPDSSGGFLERNSLDILR